MSVGLRQGKWEQRGPTAQQHERTLDPALAHVLAEVVSNSKSPLSFG